MNPHLEPTHISHDLLKIMDSWQLQSNVLTLTDDSQLNEQLSLISDVFKLVKALAQYNKAYIIPDHKYGDVFDTLYDMPVEKLEVLLCTHFAELKMAIHLTKRLPSND